MCQVSIATAADKTATSGPDIQFFKEGDLAAIHYIAFPIFKNAPLAGEWKQLSTPVLPLNGFLLAST